MKAIDLLRDLNASGKRDVPADAPMPFRKEWRRLVVGADGRINRRLYETATMAHIRNKLRSGDIWVARSSGYRRFDSYLLPAEASALIVAGLNLPPSAYAWLAERTSSLDQRLKRFAHNLSNGRLEGVRLVDGRLQITPVRTDPDAEAKALGNRIDGLMPRVRITDCSTMSPAKRLPRRLHQPANRPAERQPECAARGHPRRRHQSRPRAHGRSQPGRYA